MKGNQLSFPFNGPKGHALQVSLAKKGPDSAKLGKLLKYGLAISATLISTSCSQEEVGASAMFSAIVLMSPVAGLHAPGETRPSRVQPVRVQASNGQILSPAISKKPQAEFTTNSTTVKCTGALTPREGEIGASLGQLKCDNNLKALARANAPVGGIVRDSVLSITVGPTSVPVKVDEFSNASLGKTDYQCGGLFQWSGATIDPFLVLCGHPRSHAAAVSLIPAGEGHFAINVWIDPPQRKKDQ